MTRHNGKPHAREFHSYDEYRRAFPSKPRHNLVTVDPGEYGTALARRCLRKLRTVLSS